MIESIHIKNLRGIRAGSLERLSPLTVLVGPNSSGKSTVLDALFIATSPSPGDAVGQVVRRRTERDAEARWLLWRQGHDGPAVVTAKAANGASRVCTLSWHEPGSSSFWRKVRGEGLREEPVGYIETRCVVGSQAVLAHTVFGADNSYVIGQEPERLPDTHRVEPDVRFIDMRGMGTRPPLPKLYSEAVTQGRREEVFGFLQEVVPGLRSIEILVNAQSQPVLHLVFSDKSVPVALAGDGIRSLLRLSLELASRERGLALIEEPEVHQHPRALQQSARALLTSMRRGTQVVLSTHSLELIDALLLEAKPEDLASLSTYRLNLRDDVLTSSRIGGEDMAFARGQIEEDLR